MFAVVGGVPVAFQGPSTMPEGGGLKGVFVLLHGCTHTEADWFSLPEERRIVSLLRSRGYATLALKSRGVCWDSEVGSHITRIAESTSSRSPIFASRRRLTSSGRLRAAAPPLADAAHRPAACGGRGLLSRHPLVALSQAAARLLLRRLIRRVSRFSLGRQLALLCGLTQLLASLPACWPACLSACLSSCFSVQGRSLWCCRARCRCRAWWCRSRRARPWASTGERQGERREMEEGSQGRRGRGGGSG